MSTFNVDCDSASTPAPAPTSTSTGASLTCTIKIKGLGHQLQIPISPDSNASVLMKKVEDETGLPPTYQRLIIKGKTLKEDISKTTFTLKQQLGIQAGSTIKGILMHSPNYKIDQEVMDKITSINRELDVLELGLLNGQQQNDDSGSTRRSIATSPVREVGDTSSKKLTKAAASHLITDICCRLDMIDVKNSETLRQIRRKALHRAEQLDQSWKKET
eukprot:870208_1